MSEFGSVFATKRTVMKEIWKPVVGYEGLYEVSNLGRVKSLNYKRTGKEKIIVSYRNRDNSNGYYLQKRVTLCHNNIISKLLVHRLVAEAFIPNPENKPEIHHIDGVSNNNCADNLMWVARKEHNDLHNLNGDKGKKISEHNTNGKLSKQVAQYSLDGKLIKIWPSTMEIQRQLGYKNAFISRCCLGVRKTYKGFVWKYAA